MDQPVTPIRGKDNTYNSKEFTEQASNKIDRIDNFEILAFSKEKIKVGRRRSKLKTDQRTNSKEVTPEH